ncbi:MAG: enoyl-CoA hydratase/isomerase family protein, partial [Nitrospinae bacterium]|nr:enoyl-CoA hydratase/isomerase family protein [Nitrospinota bacterium]
MSDRVTVVEVKDRTLWVGLNRPKTLNAMNFQMINEVIEAFTRLDEDPDIGVGVMYGLNGNFSSGGDMDMMLGLNYQTGHIWNNKMRRLCMTLRNSGNPTIAMVRGWCI